MSAAVAFLPETDTVRFQPPQEPTFMRPTPPPGWCNKRPLEPPKHCRWCKGPMKLLRPNDSAVYACPNCDLTGRWPRARRKR